MLNFHVVSVLAIVVYFVGFLNNNDNAGEKQVTKKKTITKILI